MSRMQPSFPNKKQIEREMAILNTPAYMEAQPEVVGYVRLLQSARTADDLRRLRTTLFYDMNLRQKALAAVVAERKPQAKARIEQLRSRA
jgi:hypothetical protein